MSHGFAPVLTDPEPITQILAHIGEPTSHPLIHPARGPPQTELAMGFHGGKHHEVAQEFFPDDLDQTPELPPLSSGEPAEQHLCAQPNSRSAGFDPTEPEPIPDHASRGARHFDQSWDA